MQHIKSVARRVAPRKGSELAPSSGPAIDAADRELFDWLWVVMTEAYGHRWTSQYGEAPLPTWIYALRGLTRQQLERGVRGALRSKSEWPPSLGGFRNLCLQDELDLSDGAAVAGRMPMSRRLPEPPEVVQHRRETAARWLGKWREILGVGGA